MGPGGLFRQARLRVGRWGTARPLLLQCQHCGPAGTAAGPSRVLVHDLLHSLPLCLQWRVRRGRRLGTCDLLPVGTSHSCTSSLAKVSEGLLCRSENMGWRRTMPGAEGHATLGAELLSKVLEPVWLEPRLCPPGLLPWTELLPVFHGDRVSERRQPGGHPPAEIMVPVNGPP